MTLSYDSSEVQWPHITYHINKFLVFCIFICMTTKTLSCICCPSQKKNCKYYYLSDGFCKHFPLYSVTQCNCTLHQISWQKMSPSSDSTVEPFQHQCSQLRSFCLDTKQLFSEICAQKIAPWKCISGNTIVPKLDHSAKDKNKPVMADCSLITAPDWSVRRGIIKQQCPAACNWPLKTFLPIHLNSALIQSSFYAGRLTFWQSVWDFLSDIHTWYLVPMRLPKWHTHLVLGARGSIY